MHAPHWTEEYTTHTPVIETHEMLSKTFVYDALIM
jgi:hypothetical protein